MKRREDAAHALAEALEGAESKADAIVGLRHVGGCFRPEHLSTWDAFRSVAAKALAPFFDGAAQDVAWAALEGDYGRLQGDGSTPEPAVCEVAQLSLRTLQEIISNPELLKPPQVVVERFAWAGRVTLLAGREKGGKSTVGSALAASVSSGRWFLGVEGRAGRVLVVSLEEHLSDLASRLVRWKANPAHVVILDRLGDDPLADLEAAVDRVRPAAMIVDSLSALTEVLGLESGSASAWTPVMGRISRLSHDTGTAIVLIHHGRKSDGRYRDSTAIGAGVDAVLEMSEDAGDAWVRKFKAKARWHIGDFAVRLVDAETPHYELAAGELSLDARVHLYVESNDGPTTNDVKRDVTGKGSAIVASLKLLAVRDAIYKEEDGAAHRWRPNRVPNRVPGRSETPPGPGALNQGGSRENPQGLATDPVLGLGGSETGSQSQPYRMGPGTRSGDPQPGFAPLDKPPEVDVDAELDRALGAG